MDLRTPILSSSSLDLFIARVLDSEAAWTAAGEEGLARLASATRKARMVTLLWSERGEAERWGSLVAAHARTKRLSLADLLIEVLPKLAALERFVGPDWGSEPLELEIEPDELGRRLRSEAVGQFVRKAGHRETVWVLQRADGPVCLMSKCRPGVEMLPCWYNCVQAEARIAGPLADAVAGAVPLAAFRGRMLPWLAESGRLVAPGYCEGEGVIELAPSDLEARLECVLAGVEGTPGAEGSQATAA